MKDSEGCAVNDDMQAVYPQIIEADALRTFQDAYNFAGADIVGMVYGRAEDPGAISAN